MTKTRPFLFGLLLMGVHVAQAQFTYSTNGNVITLTSYTGPGGAVTISNFVTSIGDNAFAYCSTLTSVTIPNGVTSIGVVAFRSCSNLANMTIPSSVRNIGDSAFKYCTNLASAIIPDTVTNIGNNTFQGCTKMTNVVIGNKVTSVGNAEFEYCSNLVSITIGSSVTNISEGAFDDCMSLTSVTIPTSVTTIGQDAFGSSGLTNVTIPDSVTSIAGGEYNQDEAGDGAFWDCANLTTVTIGKGVTYIGAATFLGCTSLTSVTMGNSVTSIGDGAFAWSGLTSVNLSNGVTSIGQGAFEECTSLTNVTISDSVTSLGSNAFDNCSSLTSVTIGNGLTSIPDYAFSYCSSLTCVTIGNGVTSIGNSAFSSCGLSSVAIPNSVTSIGIDAFGACMSLNSVVIGNNVTRIADYAFNYCVRLNSVTIPASVKYIGQYAFASPLLYTFLTSVYFQGSAPSADSTVFDGNSRVTVYYEPGTTGWWISSFGGAPTSELNFIMFSANPTNGMVPLAVSFTSPGADKGDITITSWSWTFGDGSMSTAQNPSHTYTTTGTFHPSFIAINNMGATLNGVGPASIEVFSAITFTANPNIGAVPLTVSFTSPAVDHNGNAITSWNWSFGDGSTSTAQNPSHTYTTTGTFSPSLMATNNIGATVVGVGPASITAIEYSNLYSFTGLSDGANPMAGLILSGNTLYGTTLYGGSSGNGTVFSLNTNGTGFNSLYAFTNGTDGANPMAGLILSGNTLYGTAEFGGTAGNGTVFAINTDGTGFTNLHTFSSLSGLYAGYNSDGAFPIGGLILSGNTLYGTAEAGGISGNGTVFSLNTNGTHFKTLYEFLNGSDGANPVAGLILSGNTLYGTADYGGTASNGTIFSLNTNGTGFETLYGFTNGSDGADPVAGLIISGNALYGTAYGGGISGNGTVFSLNTNGTGFTTLHSFPAFVINNFNSDGANPYAALILSSNTLYGTAYDGGANGVGTVFSLIPPVGSLVPAQPSIASVILSGTNLVLNGINGQSGATYYVLMSTNLALPLSQWTPVATNVLSTSGNFTVTINNTVTRTVPQRFYILVTQ